MADFPEVSQGAGTGDSTVKKGVLHKKGGMQFKARYFVLRGVCLRYYNDQSEEGGKPRGELPLDHQSAVADLPAGSGGPNFGFQVVVSGGKAMKLAADTEAEMISWKLAIREAIIKCKTGQDDPLRRRQRQLVPGFEIVGPHYTVKRKVGSGAYGVVVAAVDERTGTNVAIKKVKQAFEDEIDAKRILREIRLMRKFAHPNVISLRDMLTPSSLEDFEDIYIITDLMSADLQHIIFSKTPLNEDQQQWILYQCLCGLQYIHSCGVLHRDLKPSNLLIDTETCDVKICDFGLSRGDLPNDATVQGEGSQMTEYVVTRWYRAPEIMLGYHQYDAAIDIWSMGCIFGELLGRKPLLPGQDYIDQLKLIVNLVGSPAEEDLWYVKNSNASNFMRSLPRANPMNLQTKFPDASPQALDLLTQMLTMNPRERVRVEEALTHPWLTPVREQQLEARANFTVNLNDIEDLQLNKANLQRMMYAEICAFHDDGRRGANSSQPSQNQSSAE